LEDKKIILIEDDPGHADLITEVLKEKDIENNIILVICNSQHGLNV